jgi:hypothetical protein
MSDTYDPVHDAHTLQLQRANLARLEAMEKGDDPLLHALADWELVRIEFAGSTADMRERARRRAEQNQL